MDVDWLQAHFALHLDDVPQQVLPGVWTTGAITARPHPGGYAAHHEVRAGVGYALDPYRDDLSLSLLLAASAAVTGLQVDDQAATRSNLVAVLAHHSFFRQDDADGYQYSGG